MRKIRVHADIQLPVTFLKEGTQFIAYSPALDLSTCGKTLEEARRRFGEAVLLFTQELQIQGTLNEVLTSLGWQKKNASFIPPTVIGQENYTVSAYV